MIIDFRMRPPARGFLNIGVYDDVARTAKLTECFSMKQAPSVAQKSPELMLQEMDPAGVTMGVIPGRNGHFKGSISNDDIISLLGDFPGRFVGMAGLNASKKEESLEEIPDIEDNAPVPDDAIISVDNIERLTELIGQMKPKYRDPLRLLAMGYTNREIAKSLGLTDEVVRTRLFRGRKLLWKEMNSHE